MFESELKFCVDFKYQCDYKGIKHGHPCYELVYYVRGTGLVTIGEKTYGFSPNTYCLVDLNSAHCEEGVAGTEVLYIGFCLDDKNVRLEPGLYGDEKCEILSLMKKIYAEMQNKAPYHSRMMNLLTEMLVIKFLRKRDKGLKTNEKDIDYVINFIKLNCMKNLNVKELAKSISYSYDYFRHKFVKQMGMTAKEYIMMERFRYAKDLLMNSDYTIKEVASMAGYNSPSHLSMVFKKEMDMTPNEFIKRVKTEMIHSEVVLPKE